MDKIPSHEKRHSYRLLSAAVSYANRRQNYRNQSKNKKGPQYITKSNASPKKHKVSNCYKRDTNTGQHLTFKWYPREGNAKNDCKVHTLALEIITPLMNVRRDFLGSLYRFSTHHKHNRREMQKKKKKIIIEKSRERHSHKPQPIPTPRGSQSRQK